MPRMNVAGQSVAANSFAVLNGQTNLIAGQSYEFLPQAAHLIAALNAAAAGLKFTLLVGNGIVILDDQDMSTANRWPILPDDIDIEDDVPPGRLILRVRNTTGAAVVFSGGIIDVTFG
jgi:hypothetical protein